MSNALDTLLRDVGQEIWEIQVTGEVNGDTLLDTPVQTTKKHRVYGIFSLATKEVFEKIGTDIQGDAIVYTREQLLMTSQIEYSSNRYEISEERVIAPLHTGFGYMYILRRHPRRVS